MSGGQRAAGWPAAPDPAVAARGGRGGRPSTRRTTAARRSRRRMGRRRRAWCGEDTDAAQEGAAWRSRVAVRLAARAWPPQRL